VIAIRPATAADAAAIAAIYAPHVTARGGASFEATPPDAAMMAGRIAAAGARYPWLVAERAGAVIGYAYAARFRARAAYDHSVETTIYLADAARGSGAARTLYAALLEALAERGFAQAIAVIALPNPASVRLHEAMGFRAAGVLTGVGYKHGEWRDIGLWQRAVDRA